MHIWKMSLWRTKSAIISWDGSVYIHLLCGYFSMNFREQWTGPQPMMDLMPRYRQSLGTVPLSQQVRTSYRKFPKYLDTQNICCNRSKIWTMWLSHRVMSPVDADGIANSVDPDQTAPVGAVWSRSALFAQAYLFENLGSYSLIMIS